MNNRCKRFFLFFTAFLAAIVALICFVLVVRRNQEHFISDYEKIPSGAGTEELRAVFGEPHIFRGTAVSNIFPDVADNGGNDFAVYRFSRYRFFLPIVCDFLIKNDAVCDKRLMQ